ncbi:hypothetical protein SO694_00012473 [Aureococcus anophagefferens]|uniref:Uncharacterized protein n=1 Tax=Aureococcus anophagefferens TaxID=44056 RepID=A0ABR1G219_AURAN
MAAVAAATPNVTLFKRTHASCAAGRDATFVTTKLGMAVSSNASYACAGAECADRVVATTLGNFEMHYFTSYVTPEKDVTACSFADSSAPRAFASDSWTYSEWATQGVTFYVPTLHPHLRLWTREGVAYRRRVASSGPESRETTIAIAYESGECGAGAAVGLDLAAMPAALGTRVIQRRFNGGSESNARGLPDLLPVMVSQPVVDVTALPNFLADYSEALLNTTVDASPADDDGDRCEWSSTTLDLSTLVSAWAVTLRLVKNSRATAAANYSAAFFAEYVGAAADDDMGCDAGYSRYADAHVGITLEGTSLDFNARGLCADGVGVHTGDTGDGTGSNWARGSSGVGVEFHGSYDYSFFSQWDLFVLDYCAASGFGASADACTTSTRGHHSSPRLPTGARSVLTNRWFWVGVFFVGGIVLSCYVAAVEDDAAAGRTTPYGRFRSRVRGALARATARRSDEATYVIVKDEDVPELAEVVSAEPYQAAS